MFSTTARAKTDLKKMGYMLLLKLEEWRAGRKFDQYGLDCAGYSPKLGWLGVNGCQAKDTIQHMIDAQNNEDLKTCWLDFGFKFALFEYPNKADRDAGDTGMRIIYFEDFGKEGK